MDTAKTSARLYPQYGRDELLARLARSTDINECERLRRALRQRDPNDLAYVPTVADRLRLAREEMRLARKPQEFGTSALPLFFDTHGQGDLF